VRVNPVLSVAQLGESLASFSVIGGENLRRVHGAVLLFCGMKLIGIIAHKDTFRTSQGTQCAFIRKKNWRMLYTELMASQETQIKCG